MKMMMNRIQDDGRRLNGETSVSTSLPLSHTMYGLARGSRYSVLGTRYAVLGTWYSVLEVPGPCA